MSCDIKKPMLSFWAAPVHDCWCKILLSSHLQTLDEMHFPVNRKLVVHNSLWTVGYVQQVCCSHRRLSRHSSDYLLFLLCEGEWHFPLAAEAHLAVPSDPFISCGLLSGNRTTLAGGLIGVHGGSQWSPWSHTRGVSWPMCGVIVGLWSPPETAGSPY